MLVKQQCMKRERIDGDISLNGRRLIAGPALIIWERVIIYRKPGAKQQRVFQNI